MLPTGILLAAGMVILSVLPAHAQRCGETVTGAVTLADDLACPAGHGLLVASGATLDCAGHRIVGGDAPGQYGIYVREVVDAVVRRCTVEHFEVGIRLRGATRATIEDSTTRHNTRYGLEITQASTDALVQRTLVFNNSDEGIHVSGPTDRDAGHRIVENTVDNNALEGIYLIGSDGSTIADNAVQNQGAAGIYLTDSNRNVVEANELVNDSIQLVAGSERNVLRDNTITGDRVKLDGAPNNEMHRTSVREDGGRPSNAYELNAAPGNVVVDSEGLDPIDYHIRAANGSKNVVFTRFTATPELRCFVDKRSNVRVTDPTGASVPCGKGGGKGGGGADDGGSPREKQCRDGVDNDGDGAIDCADPDCAGKAGC